MKTVAESAVEAINTQNRQNAEAKAIVLIKEIVNLQASIKSEEGNIEAVQKTLNDLMASELTYESVTGQGGLVPQNETQKTVQKAIETLVKSKQGCVEQRAVALGESVVHSKSNIAALNKRIAEKQAELAKIEVQIVSETDVMD
jgi:uncharacterized coiled-coil protein SlyX